MDENKTESQEPKDETNEQNQPNGGRPFIMILVNEDGSLRVNGFIPNKTVAFGLLESAKDEIRGSLEKASKIERVNGSGGLINHIRNGFKR